MTQTALTPPIQTHSLKRHLGYLDSLRGIAILMVLWVHSGIVGGVVGPGMALHRTWPVFFVGQRGVELFYELSAFTLFLSLSGGRREHAPGRNFYLRRFFRIAPAYYVALLLEYAWVGHTQPARWRYLLAAVFLNGWSSKAINLSIIGCWSIAVEVMFYLCVPFLFRHIRTLPRAIGFLLGTWAASVFLNKVLAHLFLPQMEYFTFLWPVAQLPVFAMGIVAFHVYRLLAHSRETDTVLASERTRKAVSALLLITAAILFEGNLGRTNSYLVPGSFCFVVLLLAGDLYAWPVLFNRPLAWLGKISFSLYLFHFFLLPWMTATFLRWMPPPMSRTLVSVCAFLALCVTAIPVSWLTWRLIEVPGIALGRDLIRKLEGRSGAAPPLPLEPEVSSPGFQF